MKRPKDLPEIGDRVEMKYRGARVFGVLDSFNPETDWAAVTWEAGGPTLCHLFELRRVPTQGETT